MSQTDLPAPWYRVPIVWLVLAIPGLTVAGCALTVFLAITHPDPLEGKSLRRAQAELTE